MYIWNANDYFSRSRERSLISLKYMSKCTYAYKVNDYATWWGGYIFLNSKAYYTSAHIQGMLMIILFAKGKDYLLPL